MTANLVRLHDQGDFHFITSSCYRRLPFLRTAEDRDMFLVTLEDVRKKYNFVVIGYVVMPEHVHLLIGEPSEGSMSVVMGVLKQRVAKRLREGRVLRHPAFWTTRYYDFNVYSQKKKQEKLGYIHLNSVRRGLVKSPDDWRWSSARYYHLGEPGLVKIG